MNTSPVHNNDVVGPSIVQVMASEQYSSRFAANAREEKEIQIYR